MALQLRVCVTQIASASTVCRPQRTREHTVHARHCAGLLPVSATRALLTKAPARNMRCNGHGVVAAAVAEVAATEFADVKTEAEFTAVLKSKVEQGILPPPLLPGMMDFYNNYKQAVLGSGVPGADEALVASVMGAIADRSEYEFRDPYSFPSYHTRIQEPYNYYEFGQRYVRNLINFDKSVLGHRERFDKIAEQLARGENVVLLANHQTEADPAVWALLLEATHPGLATDVVYVAGDRVVTDPLCKPFSMGRNLFCVHSRKRLDDIPELKSAKVQQNRRTLIAMASKFQQGGQLVWVAPSGGRDRPNEQGDWVPAAFDPSAVELMRTLLGKTERPGHLYPFAMSSWEIMPPPKSLEKGLGERRLTYYAASGISLGEELDISSVMGESGGGDEKEEKGRRTQVLTDLAFQAVTDEYNKLLAAMADPAVREGSGGVYSQPWKK